MRQEALGEVPRTIRLNFSQIVVTAAGDRSDVLARLSRKEVFQPHLPVRLPCYDLAPITGFTLGRSLR